MPDRRSGRAGRLLRRLAGRGSWAGPLLLLSLVGCTHEQLVSSTARTAGTVIDIQYQMVLDNLARMQRDPAALPSQIRIKQGTVQVSDEVGLYQLQVPFTADGTFGGPRAERTVSEQWGADAISDPLAVKQLQDIYRVALGHPPFPDPSFLAFEKDKAAQGGGKQGAPQGPLEAMSRIDLGRDVPLGWFHAGTKGQVAADARYVGHSGDVWVWVAPEDVAGLSRFSLLVLYVTKLGPGENTGPGGGLMFTGGGK